MPKTSKRFVKNKLNVCVNLIITFGGCFFYTTAHTQTFSVNPIYPNQSINTGAGRFGEGRSGKAPAFGTRPHQGVDISAAKGTPLYAVADSYVIGSVQTGNGGGIGTVLRPKNMDVAAVYWHQDSINKIALGLGKEVKAGAEIGKSGNTQHPSLNQTNHSSQLAYHLHFGVGVPKPEQAVSAWINNRPRSGSEIVNSTAMINMRQGKTPTYGTKSYYWTNPAPYLPKDTLIRTSQNPDPLVPFIGNSIRSQYNALTGANLPLGNGAVQGSRAKEVPRLKVTAHGVPNDVASEMGQAALVGIIASGNADELLGQDSVSLEELAYYAPPRTIFGGDSEVQIDIGDGDITKIELIDKIGSSRFGNNEWQSQLLGLSMRGMLIEYLNGLNAKNFLKKEMLLQKERIESLYAAWTATSAKLNLQGELQETLEKAQKPEIIPEMSRIPVEDLFERIEMGGTVDSMELSRAITLNTSGEFKQCDAGYLSSFNRLNKNVRKELIALSLRLGFHPIDFLNMVGVESSFNAQNNIYKGVYYTKNIKGESVANYPAAGFVQLTPTGASGIPYNKVISLFPQARSTILAGLGGNGNDKELQRKAQSVAHGPYLKKLQDINPRLEFAVYDGYFYSKNRSFNSLPASEKNITRLYRMVIGGPYIKGDRRTGRGYAANAQYDLNNDDRFTADEAVLHPMFRSRRCPYITDEDILTNTYGLTNDDLKLIPWDKSIERLKSPTLNSFGGYFGFSVSYKANQNSK